MPVGSRQPKVPHALLGATNGAEQNLLTLLVETEAQTGVLKGSCSVSGKIGAGTKISTFFVHFLA